MDYLKQKLKRLREEKDSLEIESLNYNNQLRKDQLENLKSLYVSLERSFLHLSAENSRLQSQVSDLKVFNISIDQRMVGLDRNINEIEYILGRQEEVLESESQNA